MTEWMDGCKRCCGTRKLTNWIAYGLTSYLLQCDGQIPALLAWDIMPSHTFNCETKSQIQPRAWEGGLPKNSSSFSKRMMILLLFAFKLVCWSVIASAVLRDSQAHHLHRLWVDIQSITV